MSKDINPKIEFQDDSGSVLELKQFGKNATGIAITLNDEDFFLNDEELDKVIEFIQEAKKNWQ